MPIGRQVDHCEVDRRHTGLWGRRRHLKSSLDAGVRGRVCWGCEIGSISSQLFSRLCRRLIRFRLGVYNGTSRTTISSFCVAKELSVSINPGLNLDAFAVQSPNAAPLPINALYLRDGQYDGMTRSDVTATFAAFRAQTQTNRLALFFHGGLVDKASGARAANQFLNYAADALPLFFIWESGFGDVLTHHLPLILAETIFGRVLFHSTSMLGPKFSTEATASAALSKSAARDTANTTPITTTTDDLNTFMNAIQSDPQIQNEAVAIAQYLAGRGIAGTAIRIYLLVLSPRTLMSP